MLISWYSLFCSTLIWYRRQPVYISIQLLSSNPNVLLKQINQGAQPDKRYTVASRQAFCKPRFQAFPDTSSLVHGYRSLLAAPQVGLQAKALSHGALASASALLRSDSAHAPSTSCLGSLFIIISIYFMNLKTCHTITFGPQQTYFSSFAYIKTKHFKQKTPDIISQNKELF